MDTIDIFQIKYGSYDATKLHTVTGRSLGFSEAITAYMRTTPYIFHYDRWNSFDGYYKFQEDVWFVLVWGDCTVEQKLHILQEACNLLNKNPKKSEPKKEIKQKEKEDSNIDPATQRLMADALKTHNLIVCPDCGDKGCFLRMTLWCNKCKKPFGGL